MGAPMGNKNAAGPHRPFTKGKKKSTGKKFAKIKKQYSRFGMRIGSPAEGYRYRTPADF